MKILYDISVLGIGQFNPLARTGVARVVENIAYGLAVSQECELFFCESLSFRILKACLDYRQSNPYFKKIPLVHSSFMTTVYSKLVELHYSMKINQQIHHSIDYNSLVMEIGQSLEDNLKKIESYSSCPEPEKLSNVDIFHATFFPIPKQTRQIKSIKKFLTVYDLIPILYPQFFGGDYENRRMTNTVDSLEPDDWALCISNATKNDLCNYLDYIQPEQVLVTHLAADPEMFYPCKDADRVASVKYKYQIPDQPYILSLSTLEPRKNIDHVIRCFAKVVEEQKIKDLSLVLVGNLGWDYGKILQEISNQNLLKGKIILTGRVADEDLSALYSGAMAFVYPSFYEGFGLPPLEAMQCGIPVITSDTSSLPEVVGEAGIMVDPKDVDGLCQSILDIYECSYLREEMSCKSLKQAKKFSWEKCIQETINAYKTALQ